jgi:hypothetical protein
MVNIYINPLSAELICKNYFIIIYLFFKNANIHQWMSTSKKKFTFTEFRHSPTYILVIGQTVRFEIRTRHEKKSNRTIKHLLLFENRTWKYLSNQTYEPR